MDVMIFATASRSRAETRTWARVAATALVLLAAVPIGHTEAVVRQERVSYADLDLGTRAGVQTLQRRIRAAVKTVCGPTPELRELNEMRAEQECRYRAQQQATAKVETLLGSSRVAAR